VSIRRRLACMGLMLAALGAPEPAAAADTVSLTYRDAHYDPQDRFTGSSFGAVSHTLGGATHVLAPDRAHDRTGWSHDGRRVAFGVGTDLFVADPDGSNRTIIRDAGGASATFSPDGQRIAYIGSRALADGEASNGVREPGTVWTVTTDGRDPRELLVRRQVLSVSWGRGNQIAWSAHSEDAGLHLIRPDGSGERLLRPGYFERVQWSPDGRRLLAIYRFSYVVVIDPRTGRMRRVGPRATATTWTPDGRIAYLARDPLGEAVLMTVRLDGRGRKRKFTLPQPPLDARDYLDVAWRPRARPR
jgi:Tol biopolymer transport system component